MTREEVNVKSLPWPYRGSLWALSIRSLCRLIIAGSVFNPSSSPPVNIIFLLLFKEARVCSNKSETSAVSLPKVLLHQEAGFMILPAPQLADLVGRTTTWSSICIHPVDVACHLVPLG